eukprot:CAMPEP_0179342464 /NCGR_PEP_ID=MMETSP0797-20121207/70418_1 /TAXON_ID=47934 /ORGANISM="Dinophysis acuminata, Strain DAEP01" /LENGTH=213 /DNA_ID=CAMNT_0021056675 /DNA_START=36 /DNA_END=675 /DNA_ORIENTATION=+
MTRQEVEEMLTALVAAYKKKEFQDELHEEWSYAGKDEMAQGRARQKVASHTRSRSSRDTASSRPKYGFEPTKKGVAQAAAACNARDSEYTEHMRWMHFALQWLVSPLEQKVNPGFVEDAQVPREELRDPERPLPGKKGSYFVVVGGEDRGGIVVRREEDTDSTMYGTRLKTGAKVRAREDVTKGFRLKYELIDGEGPEFGWVSTAVGSKKLMA